MLKPATLRQIFFDLSVVENQNGGDSAPGEVMAASEGHELTELLQAWSSGDKEALEKLVPRVHGELRRLAGRHMAGERPNHPLQTTALINEAYLRLIGWKDVRWQTRAHFFAVASQLMRRILVDIARARDGPRRGGGTVETTLDEAMVFKPERPRDLIALDEALTGLAEIDPRKSRIVELRFFGGLSVDETAMVLQLSDRTVLREWNLAKAWLHRELTQGK
jgi:RNA polymerase sigma factor (TIGR02999 family)